MLGRYARPVVAPGRRVEAQRLARQAGQFNLGKHVVHHGACVCAVALHAVAAVPRATGALSR